MPRPTRAEINEDIVDKAAALFAQHSFHHTSLQQIADALGYSKAGLLHYYPSKQLIFDTVVATASAQISELTATAMQVPAGLERDRVLVGALIELTYQHPGIAAFGASRTTTGSADSPELLKKGAELLTLFSGDRRETALARSVRIVTALGGLSTASIEALRAGEEALWRAAIEAAVLRTLGHQESAK